MRPLPLRQRAASPQTRIWKFAKAGSLRGHSIARHHKGRAVLTDWLCLQVFFRGRVQIRPRVLTHSTRTMLTIDEEVSNDVSRILITYFNFKTLVKPSPRSAKTEFLIALFFMKHALFD
jgi:hypothetical protein